MRTFSSLRHRNYRLYFVGQLVSLVGSWTQITALTWLAHAKTGEAADPLGGKGGAGGGGIAESRNPGEAIIEDGAAVVH